MTEVRFNVFAGAGTAPQFGQSGSTRSEQTTPAAGSDSKHGGLIEWLASTEARRLEGRWVLLTDDFEVVDSAETPSDLLDRHPEDRTPFVVFVDPSNVNLVV